MQTTKKIRRLGGAWLFALALMCPLANRATAPLPAVHDDTYHLALPARPFPPAYESYPYGSSINVTGGSSSYRFFISGNLPPGLVAEMGPNTLAISGVPTTAGSYSFRITAYDGNGATVSQDYSFVVQPEAFKPHISPAVITDSEGFKFTDTDAVFKPAIIVDNETFTFTDADSVFMPAKIVDNETFTFSDVESVTAKVGVTPTTAPSGTYNVSYSQLFSALGNTGAVTLTGAGTLPTGMSFSTPASTLTLSGKPTQTGAFPFTITARDTVNTSVVSYTLVINTATQTITIDTLPSPTYGGANFTLAATASPSSLPVTITSTSSLATGSNPFTPVAAGSASFQATQAGSANYSAATPVNFNVTIAKATLTATANSYSRAFDQPNPTSFGYSLATFVNGDTASVVSGSPTISTTATPISPVTTYPIALSVGTLSAANYAIGASPGTLTITKAPQTITFYPLPTLANGATFALSARASSGIAVTYTVSGPASITNDILSVIGTGLVQVTAAQAGNTNYSPATSVIRSFTAQ